MRKFKKGIKSNKELDRQLQVYGEKVRSALRNTGVESKALIDLQVCQYQLSYMRTRNLKHMAKRQRLKQLGYHSLAYKEYSYIDDLRIITNEVR